MKILHVSQSMTVEQGGGIASFVGCLTSALVRAGIHCEVCAVRDHQPGTLVPVDSQVKMHHFPACHPVARCWRAWSPSLYRFLNSEVCRFDLLHVHGIWDYACYAACRVARRHNIPYVLSPHGAFEAWCLADRRFRRRLYMDILVRPNVLKYVAGVHCVDAAELADVSKLGIQAPAFIVPCGISADLPEIFSKADSAAFLSRYPDLINKLVILFVGQLGRRKGVHILLRSFSRIASKFPDAVLLLVGSDEREKRMEAELRNSGIQGRVVLTGVLNNSDLAAAFSCANIFVLPSYSEAFGIAVLEAMAAGLPLVISDNCHSFRDQVVSGKCGIVTPVREEDLAEAIASLLADRQRREQLGRNAQRMVTEYHTWPVSAESLITHYSQIVGRHRQGGFPPGICGYLGKC